MLMRLFFFALMILVTCESFAQLSRKERKAARQSSQSSQPTTLDPATRQGRSAPKHVRKKEKSNGPTYNSQKEFEERMEARSKTYRKNEKYLMTPQYSNPAYFGHKRPPKRRPANKMKFCKECGIRH
jgi:hypothetical protein